MSDFNAHNGFVSVETTLSSEGIATTVYLHTGEDATVLDESWQTWTELDVTPARTPRDSLVSEMHGVDELPDLPQVGE